MSGFTLSPGPGGRRVSRALEPRYWSAGRASAQLVEPTAAAPLAQALLGREPGESVPFQGAEAEIVSIEP